LLCLVVHVCLHTRTEARKSLTLAALLRELALGFDTVLTVSPFAGLNPFYCLHIFAIHIFLNLVLRPYAGSLGCACD